MPGPLEAFRIGNWPVYWYGIMIVTGVILGSYVAAFEAKRRGEDEEHVWNMLFIVVALGIVGARLYHVFSSPAGGGFGWDYYKENPWAIFQIWKGGLGIYGAFAGGVLGVLLYTYRAKLNLWRFLDFGAPGLLLGQAVGRWGNFLNQELYGPPTTLPWGIKIDEFHRIPPFNDLSQYPLEMRFHPTFLYESLWCLIGAILLLVIGRKWASKLKDGDLFLGYVIWYPLGRSWIEMFRPDAWMIGNVATAQIVSAVLLIIAVVLLFVRHRKSAPTQPAQ